MATNYWPIQNQFAKPSYWQRIFWATPFGGSPVPNNAVRANGIHYPGDSVIVWFEAASAATSYKVIDWYGNTVVSGSLTPTNQLLTIPAPGGGWQLGFYRLIFDGPTNDAVWGTSYGSTIFSFVRNSSRFPAMPSSQTNLVGGSGQANDFVRKGILGFGTSRLNIDNANAPTTGNQTLALAQSDVTNYANPYWRNPSNSAYLDPVRTRYLWLAFPNQGADQIAITFGAPIQTWGTVFCKDGTVDGSKVFVTGGPGSSSGTKIQVYFPNSSTLVETYDNLASGAAAVSAINGHSAYIFISSTVTTQIAAGPTTPTAIGNAFFTGISSVVSTLFPLGVTYYEGPSNEPNLSTPSYSQAMRIFAAAVHNGNPNAKAIGPSPVDIDPSLTSDWGVFLANGGAQWADEIATHAYNAMANGDLNEGHNAWRELQGYLAKFGTSCAWQTESTWAQPLNFGLLQVRNSRANIGMTLVMEQHGIIREKNNHWYDVSHGFPSVPAWWENSFNGIIHPEAIMARVLTDETWGMTHHNAIDFGGIANNIFTGSVYQAPAGNQCWVVIAGSYMPTSTVTFRVSGTVPATMTYSDAWGNLGTLTVTSNLVTLPVQDIPVYLRVPSGTVLTLDHVNDWPSTTMTNLAGLATTFTMNNGATSAPELVDGQFLYNYAGFAGSYPVGGGMRSSLATASTATPDTATLLFPSTISADRVIVFAGNVWQKASTLIDFDVQTTANGGSSWTTRATIDRSSAADSLTFVHGSTELSCQTETWYDGQNIFDVNLGGAISCNGVRLNVRRTTYGAAPNTTASTACAFWGAADTAQHVTLTEIAVISSDHTIPARQLRTFNGTSDQIKFAARNEHLQPTTGKFSVGAWVKPSVVNVPQVVVGGGSTAWEIAVTSSGKARFTKGTTNIITTTLGFTANQWVYFGVSSDVGAGTVKFYKILEDGTTTSETVANSLTFGGGIPTIGNNAGETSWFHGPITEVAIWPDTALTQTQFQNAAANGGLSLSPLFFAPLYGGSIETDRSGFLLTGMVTGTTLTSSGFPNGPSTPVAPTNVTAPVVTGTALVGNSLASTTGTWTDDGAGVFTYQWQRDNSGGFTYSNIASATSPGYLLVSADATCHVRCVVTDTDAAGAASSASNAMLVSSGVTPAIPPGKFDPTNPLMPAFSSSPHLGVFTTRRSS